MDVEILGLNEAGRESGNADFTDGRDIPWLQPTDETPVWADWGVVYRDVWILDADNELIDVYNLTDNDLEDPANYEALRTLFTDATAR